MKRKRHRKIIRTTRYAIEGIMSDTLGWLYEKIDWNEDRDTNMFNWAMGVESIRQQQWQPVERGVEQALKIGTQDD